MTNWFRALRWNRPLPLSSRRTRSHWAFLFMAVMSSNSWAQDLVIESWRKDDEIFWEKVLIPAFERKHPGIRLTFRGEEPLSYDALLDARLATRRAGDLIFCRPFDGNVRIRSKGYLLPLKEKELHNFKPSARQAWTSDDGQITYCLPVAYVMHGMFYNKKIFKDLDLKPPVTVDEFMLVLQRIAAAGNITPLALGTADMWESTQVVFTGMGPNFWGGEKGRQGLIKRTAKFTDPEFIKAWEMMAKLKPHMHPKQNTLSNSDVQLMFATGRAGIYPTGSWDIEFLRNTSFIHQRPIDMGVFKPPLEKAGQTCHISIHPDFGIGVNQDSPNQEAALKFVAWLGSAEFAQLLTDTLVGFFSLSNHPVKVRDPLSQDMLKWRQECRETIRLNSHKINRVWPSMEEELWYANVKVINRDITPGQAARHIQNVHEKNNHLP